jgi:uncharacterized membrane protein YgdD (TMEM256/DUF423 family)
LRKSFKSIKSITKVLMVGAPAAMRVLTGLSGFSAVACGAYGAHGLNKASDYQKKVWERAATYHLVHSGAALAALGATNAVPHKAALASGALFLGGNLLFSGGLYGLVITENAIFAKIAPYGGGAYMLGWLAAAAVVLL